MTTTRNDLAALVLAEACRRWAAVQARPRPPAWKSWDVRDDEADREFGPRYSPGWFGEAGSTEARRVRLLRAVYRLHEAGLLTAVKSEGGRLERVRPTPAGIEAAASSAAAGAVDR